MDLTIQTQLLPAGSVDALRSIAPPVAAGTGAATATDGQGFANVLGSALQSVSALQNESQSLQTQFQAGVEGASLEDTMVSMQKAQIAFQSAMTVRNRLVSAYSDIMNMAV